MLLLVVWIAVAVIVLVVLGSVVYGLVGAVQRLGREVAALDRELRPVLAQVQDAAARMAATRAAVGEAGNRRSTEETPRSA